MFLSADYFVGLTIGRHARLSTRRLHGSPACQCPATLGQFARPPRSDARTRCMASSPQTSVTIADITAGPRTGPKFRGWGPDSPLQGVFSAIAGIDYFADTTELIVMNDAHSRIIASAAKAELGPIGFRQRGRSRLWLADHGYWLNVVEFTPSGWSKSVSLMNAVHWLWVGAGFMSFNEAVPSNCHAKFETEAQFGKAAVEIAKVARAEALKIETRFASFQAIADFVVERARTCPDGMGPSWWGYEAVIASELVGRVGDAREFLRSLTDELVTSLAAPLLPLIDRPDAFRREVNDLVTRQRAILKLGVLASPSF